mmetsp:Transcript_13265/g.27079  ORF Transcript_13265/g.27079 Transcript_13265/m.27079 type:complete len:231 (+) Transcript_13265:180-872(+)
MSTKSLTMEIGVEDGKDLLNLAPEGRQNLMAIAPCVPGGRLGGILFLFSSLRRASFSIEAFSRSSFSLCSLSFSSFSLFFFSCLSLSCLAVSSNSLSWVALSTLPMTFSYLLLAKAARLGLCTANVLLIRVVSWLAIPLAVGERPFILDSREPCLTRSIGRPSPQFFTLPSRGPLRSTAQTMPAHGSLPILKTSMRTVASGDVTASMRIHLPPQAARGPCKAGTTSLTAS